MSLAGSYQWILDRRVYSLWHLEWNPSFPPFLGLYQLQKRKKEIKI
jgi:hypothetical protein